MAVFQQNGARPCIACPLKNPQISKKLPPEKSLLHPAYLSPLFPVEGAQKTKQIRDTTGDSAAGKE